MKPCLSRRPASARVQQTLTAATACRPLAKPHRLIAPRLRPAPCSCRASRPGGEGSDRAEVNALPAQTARRRRGAAARESGRTAEDNPPANLQPARSSPPSPRAASQQQRNSGPSVRTVTVKRSDVANKQIITRVEGSKLGKVGSIWVDTQRWQVGSLDCKGASNVVQDFIQGDKSVYSVLLSSLRQIGDVVLVQDKQAIEMEDYSFGYSDITGWEIVTESQNFVGKVRDFEFSPDTGRVVSFCYDAFGLPAIPASAVSTFAISVNEVAFSQQSVIVVRDEYQSQQITSGFLSELLGAAEEQLGSGLGSRDEEQITQQLWDQYYRDLEDYERRYGPVSREARMQAEQAMPQRASRELPRGRGDEPQRTQESSKRASIPIIGPPRARPAYEVRDADGSLGERPPPRRQESRPMNAPPRSSGVRFEEWATEDQRNRADELLVASDDSMDEAVYAGAQPVRSRGSGYGGAQRLPPRQEDPGRGSRSEASERRRRGARREEW